LSVSCACSAGTANTTQAASAAATWRLRQALLLPIAKVALFPAMYPQSRAHPAATSIERSIIG
jgi:hypothetical protein